MRPIGTVERLAFVFVGGAVGTALRAGLELGTNRAPGTSTSAVGAGVIEFPITTLVINIVGAFLLGYVAEKVAGDGTRRAEVLRLVLGTGALGGFTTYSALSVDTVHLMTTAPLTAVVYAVSTLVGGALASWAGMAAASTRRSRPAVASFIPASGEQNPRPGEGDG